MTNLTMRYKRIKRERRKTKLERYINKGTINYDSVTGVCYCYNDEGCFWICGIWFEGFKRCSCSPAACVFKTNTDYSGDTRVDIPPRIGACGKWRKEVEEGLLTTMKVFDITKKTSVLYVSRW